MGKVFLKVRHDNLEMLQANLSQQLGTAWGG